MCGQFGIFTTSAEPNADDFISDAFVTSMLRGVDSSGIANIDLARDLCELHKLPVAGLHFATDKTAKRLMRYAGMARQLTMCHVRAATQGEVRLSNAHPFEIDTGDGLLIGTHNGTLTGWKYTKYGKDYDVDSEWALSLIAEKGVDAFKEFTGAYSFVWWDGRDGSKLHMVRNKERPMSVAFLKGGGMAWASEPGMLFWLLERNSIKMDGRIVELLADKHYEFSVLKARDVTITDMPKKPEPLTNNTGMYGTNTSTTYRTTVENMDALIAAASKPKVSDEEKRARDYGFYGELAEFTPMSVNSKNEVEGIAVVCNTEFDAIVRGDTLGFGFNSEWVSKVIGVQEEGKDMVLVLDKPTRTLALTFEDTPGFDDE